MINAVTLMDSWGLRLYPLWEEYIPIRSSKGKEPMGMTGPKPLPNLRMKIIAWNVRGASTNAFVPRAWDVIRFHKASIFIFFETKTEKCRARQVIRILDFHDSKPFSLLVIKMVFGCVGKIT